MSNSFYQNYLELSFSISTEFGAESLEGSDGRFYNGKLVLYVKAKHTKEELELDKYHEGIIAFTQAYLELDVEDVHIIAFEDHLPAPEPVNYDNVPF